MRVASVDRTAAPSADADAADASGSQTVKMVPRSRPSLWTSTRPLCSSTSERSSVSPIPRPPSERASDLIALDEEIEDAWQHLGLDAVAVVGDPDHRLSVQASHFQPDVAAAP